MGTITYISSSGEAIQVEGVAGASLMQLATAQGVPGIVAECGGSLSCATCHVYVDAAWTAAVGPPGETEATMLEFAEAPRASSRLSCQIRYTTALDGLIVHVPEAQ